MHRRHLEECRRDLEVAYKQVERGREDGARADAASAQRLMWPDEVDPLDLKYVGRAVEAGYVSDGAGRPLTRPGDHPELSFVLQYYKHPSNVELIVGALEPCREEIPLELLANVDSQEESDMEAWERVASDWVIPVVSDNIHEIRAYNRLGSMARGNIVVFLQDDDIPPDSCQWLRNLVALYKAFPSLAIVGMKVGVYKYGHTRWSHDAIHFRTPFSPQEQDGEGIVFQFVSWVDYAPFAIRKQAFTRLGGVDESFSPPGESGIFSDVDLCFRAWEHGWRVGHMGGGRNFRKGPAWTTDTAWGRKGRAKAEIRNQALLEARHFPGYAQDDLPDLIQTLNNDLLVPLKPGRWVGSEFLFTDETLPGT